MKIKELTQEQLLAELVDSGSGRAGIDHEGETLEEFVEISGLSFEATVSELHEFLVNCGIQSPFRELGITTEVTRSRGYTIAVTDEQYARYVSGELGIDELEPNRFNLEEAYYETEFGDGVSSSRDYAVSNGFGRNIVDWD